LNSVARTSRRTRWVPGPKVGTCRWLHLSTLLKIWQSSKLTEVVEFGNSTGRWMRNKEKEFLKPKHSQTDNAYVRILAANNLKHGLFTGRKCLSRRPSNVIKYAEGKDTIDAVGCMHLTEHNGHPVTGECWQHLAVVNFHVHKRDRTTRSQLASTIWYEYESVRITYQFQRYASSSKN